MRRILLAVIFIVLVIVAAGLVLKNIDRPDGLLVVSSSTVDFGDIDQGAGAVEATVEVSNAGGRTLEIYRLSTSCGCTTVQMDQTPLAPGDRRTLLIRFDPMVHPDESGQITRAVYLQSSDPEQPEVIIDITGNVIPTTSL